MPAWVEKILVEILGRYLGPILSELVNKYLDPATILKLVEEAKIYAVCWAKTQTANTANKIDDEFVGILADALGVDASKCPVPSPGP